jgi:hypothetical protein
VRGGSEEEGLLLAAVVGATSVHALRVQLDAFTKWNAGAGYSGMLLGGQRASLQLAELVLVHHRVSQALGALDGGARSLRAMRSRVASVATLLADCVRTLTLLPPPSAPSALASTLTSMMEPEVPPHALLDMRIAGSPPRLLLSAYLLKPADGTVADARHVPVEVAELGERLEALSSALHATKALLAKIDAVDGLR